MAEKTFWQTKALSALSGEEWEKLCDGCGLCCLHKLEDEDTGEISYTDVACRLMDIKSCQCRKYKIRKTLVPDCVVLDADMVHQFRWLPKTCAYRRIAEKKDLYDWHPLISGSDQTVHEAGISVRGKVVDEKEAGPLEDHIVLWPMTEGDED